MKVKISSGRKVEDDSSMPRRVTSPTDTTDASEEYLMSWTKFAARGGSTLRMACGPTMLHEALQWRQAQHLRRFAMADRNGRGYPPERPRR